MARGFSKKLFFLTMLLPLQKANEETMKQIRSFFGYGFKSAEADTETQMMVIKGTFVYKKSAIHVMDNLKKILKNRNLTYHDHLKIEEGERDIQPLIEQRSQRNSQ